MKFLTSILFLLCAFSLMAGPRQTALVQSPKSKVKNAVVTALNTNRVPVLVSSVLLGSTRKNVFRSMAETNALKIVDLNVTNTAPPSPPLNVTVSFQTLLSVLVRDQIEASPHKQTFNATISFTDTNAGSRFYQVERPAFNQTVDLSWFASPSENVAGYNVYIGTYPGTWTDRLMTVETHAQFTSLPGGGPYNFFVRAFDGAGTESDDSNEVTYTVPTYEVLPTVTLQ